MKYIRPRLPEEEIEYCLEAFDKDEAKVKGITGLLEKDVNLGEIPTIKNDVKNLILSRNEDGASELITVYILTYSAPGVSRSNFNYLPLKHIVFTNI